MPIRILIGTLVLVLSTGVHADDHDDDDDNDNSRFRVAAGAGVSVEQSPYVGGKDSMEVLPLLFVQMGRFYLRGPTLGAELYDGGDLSVSAGISLDFADSDRGDSPQLADMAELDDVWLGEVEVSYEADWGELDFSLAADVSGTHDGYLAGLSYGYPLELGGLQIEPEVGVEWHSARVNRYYYGVGAGDVRSDRPFYEPDAGMNYELGVTVTYPFAKRHALSLEVKAERLSSEVSDSPIIDRDNVASVGVSYLFRF